MQTLLVSLLLVLIASPGFAQRGQGRYGMGMNERPGRNQQFFQMIPDLSEEQESKIETLRVDHMKEMMSKRNTLNEKRAKLRTLQTQDKPDMQAINSLIEEMGDVRTEMQKKRASHHQEIRSLLTEEQKVYFDNHLMRRGKRGFRNRPSHPGKMQYSDCPRGDYRGRYNN
jgi:Spy/CpxP family protein refolding chaperone